MTNSDPIASLYLSLTLIGRDLIPNEITSKLHIQPSHFFQRGESFGGENSDGKVRKQGLWEISSDKVDLPPDDIVTQFNWLLDLVEPVKDDLHQILEDKAIQARLCCFWIVPDGRINVEVEPMMLSRIASLGLKIWFDVYSDKS